MKIIETVKESWNKIGSEYYRYRDLQKMNPELEKFISLLTKGAHVLDAGTGAGIPLGKFLVDRGFQLTGIDISEKMIAAAKKNVPKGNFLQRDILDLDFPDETFDGLTCVYTLWHIPRETHFEIFQNFKRMLKKDGILMINTGIRESEGLSTFFGQPMLWSNNNPQKTLAQVKELGFSILSEGVLERGGEYQYWIFAKK